jgi:hypothetical protein
VVNTLGPSKRESDSEEDSEKETLNTSKTGKGKKKKKKKQAAGGGGAKDNISSQELMQRYGAEPITEVTIEETRIGNQSDEEKD